MGVLDDEYSNTRNSRSSVASVGRSVGAAARPAASRASASSTPKLTPAPTKAKESMASAAKVAAGWSTSDGKKKQPTAAENAASWSTAKKQKASAQPSRAGESPSKRTVKTTTVRPSGSDPVGDGPSLGMFYDLIESPVYGTKILTPQPMTRDNMWFTSQAPASNGIAAAASLRPEGGLNSDRYYERAAAAGGKPFEGVVDLAGMAAALTGGGGLNSARYYERAAEAGGKPFEGVVDWAGIAAALTGGGGLNSARYYERAAEAGGKPFEGVVDWAGIAEAMSGRKREPVVITVPGGTPMSTAGGPNMTVAERNALAAVDYYNGSSNPILRPGDPGMTWQEAQRGVMQPVGYIPDRLVAESPAVTAIDAAAPMGAMGLPRRDPRGYGNLFETDGQVLSADGAVIRPGVPAAGIDVAAAPAEPAEPTMFDKVVDGTGKLLSNTALGGIVSTLFPEFWNDMGSGVKAWGNDPNRVINGAANPTGNPSATYWDPLQGQWTGGDATNNDNPNGQGRRPRPDIDFPDENDNGIDDREEEDDGNPPPPAPNPNPVASPTRRVRFPDMPPYNPGRDDEWLYFLNNHLADGGMVRGPGHAEGGQIDESDPRVQLIEKTEDVLEQLAAGQKPDEAATETLKAFVAQFGDAALKSLHENVAGGMTMKSGRQIKGPGGPKDDAVPAVIVDEGSVVSPAKLSNNEFVMPVSAVEGIGEGDVELGAQRMQELADRLSKRSAA